MARRVVLVDTQSIAELRSRLERAPRVALDTEFHAERRYLPKLYLVQLHLDDGSTWIIDALDPELLEILGPTLRKVTWVVHGGRQDLRILLPLLGELPEVIYDTQLAAGLVSDRFPAPYAKLLEEWTGVNLDKGETLSDWSRRPLTEEQRRYAAEDVRALLPLWDTLALRAEELGRSELLRAACGGARDEALDPSPSDTAWRSIPAATVLSRQQASVLQELAAWRERMASAMNQPPHAVVGTAILVDLARRQPITMESLAANRRLPKGIIKRHGDALLEAIGRALARPPWAWPDPIPDASDRARTRSWLHCLLQAEGARQRWAPSLVLPSELLEDVVTRPPRDLDSLADIIGPWRTTLCGDLLLAGLSGEISLTLSRGDVEVVDRLGAKD